MKNKFYIVFFTLILAGFAAFGQETQIITHVDTLQSGDVIVTISDSQGNIIDKGLAKPGFSCLNDTSQLNYTPSSFLEIMDNSFSQQVDMPGADGGFLPQDIIFNPYNSKYYIYGYRKMTICNSDLEPEKTIEVSDIDNFSPFYSDYHQNTIDLNVSTGEVFCLGLNGELIVVDQQLNRNTLVDPIENTIILRASMKYYSFDNSILYFLLVINQNGTLETKIFKYALTEAVQQTIVESSIIGYDLDFISLDNHYKIYLATDHGIRIYNDDLSNPITVEPAKTFDHIKAMNSKLFSHESGTSDILIYNAGGDSIGYVACSYNEICYMISDAANDHLFISGYHSTGSGINIIGTDNGIYTLLANIMDYPNIYGMSQNGQQVIGCGKDDVVYINKTTLSCSGEDADEMGQMYRIAANSNTDIACAIQPLNGNAVFFNPEQDDVLDLGGRISATCIKGEYIYAAVHKYNQEGYILVLNASSGEIIHKVQPNFDFNPVDMFCSNSPEIENDRIYVVYVDMTDPVTLLRLMYFDSDDYSITNTNITITGEKLDYLITPNQTIVLGRVSGICSQQEFYFYNYNLQTKADPYVFDGCIHDFVYFIDGNFNYIAQVDYCGGKVRFFKDQVDTCYIYATTTVQHAEAIAYHEATGLVYCVDDYGYLRIIDPGYEFEVIHDYNLELVETVHSLFYNQNDEYVYGLSENILFKFTGSNTLPLEYDLPYPQTDENKFDDIVMDNENNRCYLVSDGLGNPYYSTYVMMFDFVNDPEVIGSGSKFLKITEFNNLIKIYSGKGTRLSVYSPKQNVFCAGIFLSNTLLTTTHTETKTLTGNYDWISFPCMPRLGNEGFSSQAFLQNINPLQGYLRLTTKVGGDDKELTYTEPEWNTENLQFLFSTQGYKYYSEPVTTQNLEVTGVVLDPSTPVPLSSQYENWIGYFLEYPLRPEKAFALVWDKLTRITTKNWTMVKVNGQWISASRITPINYGDGLIVTCSEDCDLIWGYQYPASEEYEYPLTEYFGYDEKSEYIPFYFEMDSISGIQEIGLTVNDSCVGAAVVEPGDSIVEVNAYLAGFPSGVPIDVETWSGYKSARIGTGKYSVVDPSTRKRVSRKVYTGEQKAFYIISFKAGETEEENPLVILNPASPNPFSSATMLSFVLNQQANVALTVHDLRGNLIKTLMHGVYNEGFYEAGWTGTNTSRQQAGNGVYIIRLTVDDKIIKHEKVVLIN